MGGTGQVTRPQVSTQDHQATRYLCAAAHLDSRFADLAIQEFLVEPQRALPPSPGVDAAVVLREAVAARTRRLMRDWTLLLLLIGFAVCAPIPAVLWFGFGIVVSLLGAGGRRGRDAVILIGVAVLVCVVLAFGSQLSAMGGALSVLAPGGIGFGPVSITLGMLTLGVLLADEIAVYELLTRSFRRGSFIPTPTSDTWPGERWVRNLSRMTYQFALNRVTKANRGDNVVVYRDYKPFVGGGSQQNSSTVAIAISLDRPGARHQVADEQQRTFPLAELYDHVSRELAGLAGEHAMSLAPSNRLRTLRESVQVVVPAQGLLENLGHPAAQAVLPTPSDVPNQRLANGYLATLIEQPLEWMRYYRCYLVQTWEGDVNLAFYLHFGVGKRTLYLEWIPCVLFPISDEYRVVDTQAFRPWQPLATAMVTWLRLPGSLLLRLGSMLKVMRRLPEEPGVIPPERYGAKYSLRELAAGGALNNYFQRTDVSRYLQVVGGRMTRAVGEFLESKGISVTEFMARANTVINQNTILGDMVNSVIGDHNTNTGNKAGE